MTERRRLIDALLALEIPNGYQYGLYATRLAKDQAEVIADTVLREAEPPPTPSEELQQARDTNKRLNRRLSMLEGAVRQMWDACRVDGVKLSRRHDQAWAVVREMERQLDESATEPPPTPEPPLRVVVNGCPVEVDPGPVEAVIEAAIKKANQWGGAPLAQWELRTREGDIIPHDLPGYKLSGGTLLFMHLGLPPASAPAVSAPPFTRHDLDECKAAHKNALTACRGFSEAMRQFENSELQGGPDYWRGLGTKLYSALVEVLASDAVTILAAERVLASRLPTDGPSGSDRT